MHSPSVKSRKGKVGATAAAASPSRLDLTTDTTNGESNDDPDSLNSNNNNNQAMNSSFSSPLELLLPPLTSTSSGSTTKNHPGWTSLATQTWSTWHRRLPCLKRVQQQVLRVPPRFRWAFCIFWFGWKILLVTLIFVFSKQSSVIGRSNRASTSAALSAIPLTGLPNPVTLQQTRILYIVTTLSEYNTGTRATTKGQDRLGEVLIPVLVDSVQTMVQPPFEYHVDVFLICAYSLSPEREELIRDALPAGVGLQVWDNAAPLGYERKHSPNKVIENTRALARQHRYVIKDKAFYYDIFLAFEDDMRVTGHHVQNYMALSNEIDRLREQAPSRVDQLVNSVPENVDDFHHTKFYGDMTKEQLARVIPGFIRVEVLLNSSDHGAQKEVLPIDQDFHFAEHSDEESHVDPRICCHVHMPPNTGTPDTPQKDDLIIWETNAKAFTLRQFPPGSSLLDWAVIMLGPGKRMDRAELLGGYWSGREGAFGDEPRPSGGPPALIAQQGGWMLTLGQIARMHNGLCLDSFLPPYDEPSYQKDGQDSMNVEFWSGSYQIFTGVKGGCNMQRIISMHPDHFSKHLIYHVANNKQRQLTNDRMVRADHLFGQLNTVKKMAQQAKAAKK